MELARIRRLAIPVILTALTACDNVSWGGVELRLQAPAATAASPTPVDTAAPVEEGPPPLDLDPALFLVRRTPEAVRMLPVALLGRSELRSLPGPGRIPDFTERFRAERMSADRSFILFAEGRRVGAFHPDSGGAVDTSYCTPRPTALGRIEVVPEAVDVDRFLALPREIGERRDHADFAPVTSTRPQRVASLNMAASLFASMRIQWPPSILASRADVQVFRPAGETGEIVAATFLYGDSLGVGAAPDNAYSLFLLGEASDGEYEPSYVRYREVGVDGKAATRFVDHLDWNEDGRDELLLEVYGVEDRWFESVGREGRGWHEAFREDCGTAVARAGEADGGGAGAGATPDSDP